MHFRKLTLRSLPASLGLVSPAAALAQTNYLIPKSENVSGFSIQDIGQFIGAILTLIFIIAGVLVFVYIVWGGIQWLTSGGDSGKAEEARNRITAALIGLAIIAIAYALVRLISYFFGITIVGDEQLPKPY